MIFCSLHRRLWIPALQYWLLAPTFRAADATAGHCIECINAAKEDLQSTAPHLYAHIPPVEPLPLSPHGRIADEGWV